MPRPQLTMVLFTIQASHWFCTEMPPLAKFEMKLFITMGEHLSRRTIPWSSPPERTFPIITAEQRVGLIASSCSGLENVGANERRRRALPVHVDIVVIAVVVGEK